MNYKMGNQICTIFFVRGDGMSNTDYGIKFLNPENQESIFHLSDKGTKKDDFPSGTKYNLNNRIESQRQSSIAIIDVLAQN